jgi:haloalkane dehalogenase
MEALRTPDDRFTDLPGFPFAPNYGDVDDTEGGRLRVHYLDEGPRDGEVVLCMHGEPSWCYLYRKMIPVFVDAGYRVIAPDLVGFGRSDKPAKRTDYTYARHVTWMRELLFDQLDLHGITLVCQDWGGLIGLRLVGEHPDRFARVAAANTFLPTGDRHPGDAFMRWQNFSQTVEDFAVGFMVTTTCVSKPGPEIAAAYDAPYPDDTYKAGARQFPLLVPTSPDDPAAAANRAAWETLHAWTKPFLTAFSDQDPITRGGDEGFQREVPGCAGQPHTTMRGTSSKKTRARSSLPSSRSG